MWQLLERADLPNTGVIIVLAATPWLMMLHLMS